MIPTSILRTVELLGAESEVANRVDGIVRFHIGDDRHSALDSCTRRFLTLRTATCLGDGGYQRERRPVYRSPYCQVYWK